MSVAAPYRPASEYQRARVQTASPTQLVLMLYDGAIRFLTLAREQMAARDLEARHTSLLKAQRIIAHLMSSLDREQGGEVAANLHRLYAFMLRRLVEANLRDRPQPIEEVIGIMRELRESWEAVDQRQRQNERGITGHGD